MELKTKIRKAWKNLIFRRVNYVVTEGNPIAILRKRTEITQQLYNTLSEDVKERECEIKYRSYSGLTNSRPLQTGSEYCQGCCKDYDHTVSFRSEDYCELDMANEHSSFYFDPDIPLCKMVDSVPRARRSIQKFDRLKEPFGTAEEIEKGNELIQKGKTLYREARAILSKRDSDKILSKLLVNTIELDFENRTKEAEEMIKTARDCFKKGAEYLDKRWVEKLKTIDLAGDIICGVVDPRNKNRFKYWFIASEQFYRTFQIIMHESHPKNTRKKILSGSNSLCTNTHLKRMMELDQTRSELQNQEKIASSSSLWADIIEADEAVAALTEKLQKLEEPEYWNLRSEKISREYCHLYPALILLCIYAEKLTQNNVPGGLKMWQVPAWMKD